MERRDHSRFVGRIVRRVNVCLNRIGHQEQPARLPGKNRIMRASVGYHGKVR
jgi:hypothetical protein